MRLWEVLTTKRLLSLALVVTVMLSVSSPSLAAALPTDAESSRYAAAIAHLAVAGVISGYADGTYRPDAPISRAEFAVLIGRALRLSQAEVPYGLQAFPDVGPNYGWAGGYIAAAARCGLLKGDPDGRFRPDAPVTGGEMAAIIVRSLGYEAAMNGEWRPWPYNYVSVAESLGIWSPEYPVNSAVTRGMVASCLNSALSVEILSPGPDGAPRRSGETMLSRAGLRSVAGEVVAVGHATTAEPAWIEFRDSTLFPSDGRPDRVWIDPAAVIYGVTHLEGLASKDVEITLNAQGRAVFITAAASGVVSACQTLDDSCVIWLDDGSAYSIDGGSQAAPDIIVYVNHRPAQLAAITPGAFVRLSLGSAGQVQRIDAMKSVSGKLERVGPYTYSISEDSGAQTYFIVSAETAYRLNGESAVKSELDAQLMHPGQATATLSWDNRSGTAARVDVTIVDDSTGVPRAVVTAETRYTRDGSFRFIQLAGDSTFYRVSPAATVVRNGTPAGPYSIFRGDLVRLRTLGGTEILYAEVTSDRLPPVAELPARVNYSDHYAFTFDEPIDPDSLAIWVDGTRYYLLNNNLNSFAVEVVAQGTRSSVTITPRVPFAAGTKHRLQYTAKDYAGNETSGEATFTVDLTPMRAAGIAWQRTTLSSGEPATEIMIIFEGDEGDTIDEKSLRDLRNWTFTDANPANGITAIKCWSHVGAYCTLLLDGVADPGSRLQGRILDSAGNAVTVDTVCPK